MCVAGGRMEDNFNPEAEQSVTCVRERRVPESMIVPKGHGPQGPEGGEAALDERALRRALRHGDEARMAQIAREVVARHQRVG